MGEQKCGLCGYLNEEQEDYCLMCGSPLSDKNHISLQSNIDTPQGISGTEGGFGVCPNCAYPVLGGLDECPACGFDLSKAFSDKKSGHITHRSFGKQKEVKAQSFDDLNPDDSFFSEKKTEKKKASFRLIKLSDNHEISFQEGGQFPDRESLDPGNSTIAEDGHLEIKRNKNGDWKLKNLDPKEATFVQVLDAESLIIKSGTVLLIGNKFFRFESDE